MITVTEQQVQALYIGYFGRAAEPFGFEYWRHQLEHGMTLNQVAASFSVQPEARAQYDFLAGTSTNASEFIDQVYANLFDREPDAEGKAYWMEHLTASAGNPEAMGAFIIAVVQGAQGVDITTLAEKVEDGLHFTSEVAAAHIETDVFENGVVRVSDDTLAAAQAVVDGVGDADEETADFIDAHSIHVEVPGPVQIVEVPVEVPVIVEVPGPTVEVPVEVIVEVPVEVPGPTVYVPVEPEHETAFFLNATLPLSSTRNYDGLEMTFGAGNLPTNYAYTVDYTAGELIGLKAHYRTGNDVVATAGTGDVDAVWTMPAGAQSGTIGNENGANPARSHASLDIVLDFGVGLPEAGDYALAIDNDPTAATAFQIFTLAEVAPGSWAFVNEAGVPVQGLTSGNGGHVLADSFNFGFDFAGMPRGASGTGDVLPGTYDVVLVGVHAEVHGQFVLA